MGDVGSRSGCAPARAGSALTERAAATFADACASRCANACPRLRSRGGAFRQPSGVLHVRRGCGPAARSTCSPGCCEQAQRTAAGGVRGPGRATCSARCQPAGGSGSRRWRWFNGGLFDDDAALPLEAADEIDTALKAAADLDWSEIDPSILGTLFERGLDPGQALAARRALHRPRQDHADRRARVVDPSPGWRNGTKEKAEIAATPWSVRKQPSSSADRTKRLNSCRAGGSHPARLPRTACATSRCSTRPAVLGNFLYLALHALKDIEHQRAARSRGNGFPARFSRNRSGECERHRDQRLRRGTGSRVGVDRRNPVDAAQRVLRESRDPILKPLETIECRDAILDARRNTEPDWPEADVVIGNPPFLGGKRLIKEPRRRVRLKDVRGLCWTACRRKPIWSTYWFVEDRRADGRLAKPTRAGPCRHQFDPRRCEPAGAAGRDRQDVRIYDAWSDEPWVIDGAAVRVSLVCFANASTTGTVPEIARLDGRSRGRNPRRPDGAARRRGHRPDRGAAGLSEEQGNVAFMGDTKSGPVRHSRAIWRGHGSASPPTPTGGPTPMCSSPGSTAWT